MLENDEIRQYRVASSPRPISPQSRIEAIDAVRGIAILGVLIAYAVWNLGSPPVDTYGTFDRVLTFVLNTFLNTKAYTLLAFLFGMGFSMQLLRARERGEDVVPVYRRRLLVLMAIGIIHSLLLRNGDILVPYASVGFALLLFRNAKTSLLVTGAVLGSALPFITRWLWEISGVPYPSRPDTVGMGHVAANWEWAKYWYATAITLWPEILPMFLAGLYVGRKRIFEDLGARTKGLRRVLITGLVVGAGVFVGRLVVIGMIEWPESPTHPLSVLLRFSWNVHAWGFAAFYGSALLLLLQRSLWKKILSPLAAFGRMALTNYLLQSIIIVPICIVFDLYDKVTPSFGLQLALGVAAIQVPMSLFWLKYFRFGPAEWLWRSLTYKAPQPMSISAGKELTANVASLQAVE